MQALNMTDIWKGYETPMGMISEKYCTPFVPLRKVAHRKAKIRKDYAADENWRIKGLCRDSKNPDLWYPLNEKDAERGKAICRNCPVRIECAGYALANKELNGTWGATSEWDRQKVFRFKSPKSS